jgi:hypothetical protein
VAEPGVNDIKPCFYSFVVDVLTGVRQC